MRVAARYGYQKWRGMIGRLSGLGVRWEDKCQLITEHFYKRQVFLIVLGSEWIRGQEVSSLHGRYRAA